MCVNEVQSNNCFIKRLRDYLYEAIVPIRRMVTIIYGQANMYCWIPALLEGVLGVGELVLDLVLVELHVDVVVPGQGVTRLLFLLLTE